MGKIQVMAVIVRLFSISLFILTIHGFPRLVLIINEGVNSTTYIHAAILLVMLLISIFLWFFPQTIAKTILPEVSEPEQTKWDNDSLLSVGFIILGVYFMYYVIVDASYWFFVILYSIGNNPVLPIPTADKFSIYITIIELILSLFLIFGSRGLANLILKFRGKQK